MCYSLKQGVFHHMKKTFRGIVVILAVLTALLVASVAQAVCYYDSKGNIVWCSDGMGN